MGRNELQALIDRVIGKKGILRVPAWWANKVLNSIIEYCESLTPKIKVETEVNDSGNPVSSAAVKGYVDTGVNSINSQIGDINTILDNINGEVK